MRQYRVELGSRINLAKWNPDDTGARSPQLD